MWFACVITLECTGQWLSTFPWLCGHYYPQNFFILQNRDCPHSADSPAPAPRPGPTLLLSVYESDHSRESEKRDFSPVLR